MLLKMVIMSNHVDEHDEDEEEGHGNIHGHMSDVDSLCLCVVVQRAAAVPRPVGLVPGLAVAKALTTDSHVMASVQLVEVFMYPGNGHVIYTGANVSSQIQGLACLL